ncbi:MAG: hypothetical protein AAGE52_38595 [Myxococcota bacterium]
MSYFVHQLERRFHAFRIETGSRASRMKFDAMLRSLEHAHGLAQEASRFRSSGTLLIDEGEEVPFLGVFAKLFDHHAEAFARDIVHALEEEAGS